MSRKSKRVPPCETDTGKKIRRLIGKVTDAAELYRIAKAAHQRARKMADDRRAAEAQEAWLALEPGLYRLSDNIISHSVLLPGVVYRIEPHRGRKHKGAHCVRASIENPKRSQWFWLHWGQSADLVPATMADTDDEKRDQAMRIAGVFS